jgi:hypothetical protein
MFLEEKILNRKIVEIHKSSDGEKFDIEFEDGIQHFMVEGECCSRSWIEHMEFPSDIKGATLLSVHHSPITVTELAEYDILKVYETCFRTDKGDIILEYRNSSNGYYGGELIMLDDEGK